jgi:hypothetical protein
LLSTGSTLPWILGVFFPRIEDNIQIWIFATSSDRFSGPTLEQVLALVMVLTMVVFPAGVILYAALKLITFFKSPYPDHLIAPSQLMWIKSLVVLGIGLVIALFSGPGYFQDFLVVAFSTPLAGFYLFSPLLAGFGHFFAQMQSRSNSTGSGTA